MFFLFGTKHLIILAVCLALITGLVIAGRRLPLKKWYRFLLVIGIISETLKVFSYIIANEKLYGGYLPKTDLPFQLCSIQLIFIAILNFTKNEKLHRVLLSFMLPTCLVGGASALLLPTSSSLSMPVITVQYFLFHCAIVAFAIHLYQAKEIRWEKKDYVHALAFLAVMALIAVYLNSIVFDVVDYTNADGVREVSYVSRVNFMYVVDPPVSGLPFLNKDHGWLVYIAHFACTAVFAVTACFIPALLRKKAPAAETTAAEAAF